MTYLILSFHIELTQSNHTTFDFIHKDFKALSFITTKISDSNIRDTFRSSTSATKLSFHPIMIVSFPVWIREIPLILNCSFATNTFVYSPVLSIMYETTYREKILQLLKRYLTSPRWILKQILF